MLPPPDAVVSASLTLTEAFHSSDPAEAERAFDAMMTVKKIDVAQIDAARRG